MRDSEFERSGSELETRRLRLVYLYGDLMSLYGDRGNILAIQRRCAWRGIDLEIQPVGMGEPVDPDRADLFFFGGGQDREQETVSRDLAAGNGAAIREAVDAGAALLAVCGGYQLLGRFFRTASGLEIPGIGLFDATTVAGPTRLVGNVLAETALDGGRRTLVGFENHSGRTWITGRHQPVARPGLSSPYGVEAAAGPNAAEIRDSSFEFRGGAAELAVPHASRLTPHAWPLPDPARASSTDTAPLARVLVGGGNNGEDGSEGARRGGAIGTYLHGPILPKNPWLADWLILTALRRRLGPTAALEPLDDSLELAASSAVERRVRKKGNVRTSIR